MQMFSTKATSQQGDRKQHAALQNKISITLLRKGKNFLTRYAFSSASSVCSSAPLLAHKAGHHTTPPAPWPAVRGQGDVPTIAASPSRQWCTESSTEVPLRLWQTHLHCWTAWHTAAVHCTTSSWHQTSLNSCTGSKRQTPSNPARNTSHVTKTSIFPWLASTIVCTDQWGKILLFFKLSHF